ncbi:hypothetical protein [Streptomyces oceani]|uniref:Uncharacterized protein n=1 Tax=Streptomyces oceani TaxID=1075402 RepID=A0A1E7KJ50_9ACTN|nr:hypothetical protein [Streptomyces oceani]OEV03935.1 hypothetical protein AN216_09945 [Streptomyces oceani]
MPERHDHRTPPHQRAEPRSRSGVLGRRWKRTGTEPLYAQSALGVRLLLSVVFLPLFLAGTLLFWYWTAHSSPGDVPSSDSLLVLTLVCAGLTLFAAIDLVLVLRRRARERR